MENAAECAWCGRKFEKRTKRAVFCSPKCRQAHYMARKRRETVAERVVHMPEPNEVRLDVEMPTDTSLRVTEKMVSDALMMIRGGTAVLDAASVNGPSRMRVACAIASEKIAGYLREVGL